MDAIRVMDAVDFDWTRQLKSVWDDFAYNVPELHQSVFDEIMAAIERMKDGRGRDGQLGKVMAGLPGSGKTHLLGAIRREAQARGCWFILVDMTDVRDFYETALLGFLESLQTIYPDGRMQYVNALERFLHNSGESSEVLTQLGKESEEAAIQTVHDVILSLRKRLGNELRPHQDVLRALLYFHAQEPSISDIGYGYLMGFEQDQEDQRRYRFVFPYQRHAKIIESLSWILSVEGVTVLAFDQLDAIVNQYHLASGAEEERTDEQKKALSIIEGIANGLSSMYEHTNRTLLIVLCIFKTWSILQSKAVRSSTDRFAQPMLLHDIANSGLARDIVRKRLALAFAQHNYTPPHPTWPFKSDAFERDYNMTPRDLLKACEANRRKWLQEGRIYEIDSLTNTEPPPPPPNRDYSDLIYALKEEKNRIAPAVLLDESHEDERLGALLQDAYRYLLEEIDFPDDVDAALDTEFPSGKSIPPLHARIRLVHRGENDREDHYCVRAMLRSNAVAFQNRLKAAMTASGIDRKLKFRRLALIRIGDPPSGAKTQQMTREFVNHNGILVQPIASNLCALESIRRVESSRRTEIQEWLKAKKPVSSLPMMKDALDWIRSRIPTIDKEETQPAEPSDLIQPTKPEPAPTPPPPPQPEPPQTPRVMQELDASRFQIGVRLIGGQEQAPIFLDTPSLTKHAVILAGSGSGKTVLVKRLVEEAALRGIPSVVIDAANDLSLLGDPWPQPSEKLNTEDEAKARLYFERSECKVWTPGREQGNPLTFSPLPELAAVKDDSDQLSQAVSLAAGAFKEMLKLGQTSTAQTKMGVLSGALRYFAEHGHGGLDAFVELLADLPIEASGGISKAQKYGVEMADQIRAAIQTNPLLRQSGADLDPSTLFGLDRANGKTCVSVINFIGLPGLESQQIFLNQLAMALFIWLKRHPAPDHKPLQGLLIIDEARDFIPSIRSSPCKESIISLVAQARKYGLGLVFATQAPKSIDHNVIANCATQFFGRANSHQVIQTIQDLLQQKGGTGSDVARLRAGMFYLHAESINGETIKAPILVKTPMSLSYHPESPLDEQGVLQRAKCSRNP